MKKISNRYVIIASLLSVFLFISSCATMYQKKAFSGGYSEKELSTDTWAVKFEGNGYSKMEKVKLYVLYRSAELTKEKGKKYFEILENKEETEKAFIPGTGQTTTTGGKGVSLSVSSENRTIEWPKADLVIHLTNEKKPGANVYDADEVIKSNQEKIDRAK